MVFLRLAALAALIAPPTPHTLEWAIDLDDLTCRADAIVVGRLGERSPLPGRWPGAQLVEVRVDRVFRGDAGTARAWVVATSSWPDDGAAAQAPCVLFLDRLPTGGVPVDAPYAIDPSGVCAPLFGVSWRGHGVLPVSAHGGGFAVRSVGRVTASRRLAREPLPEDTAAGAWSCPLDVFLPRLERIVAAQDRGQPRHPVTRLSAYASVVVDGDRVAAALWSDGSALWSADPARGGPPYTLGRVRAEAHGALVRAPSELSLEPRVEPERVWSPLGVRTVARYRTGSGVVTSRWRGLPDRRTGDGRLRLHARILDATGGEGIRIDEAWVELAGVESR